MPHLSFPQVPDCHSRRSLAGIQKKGSPMNPRLPLMLELIRSVTRHGASPGPRNLNERLPMAVFNLSEDT